MKDKKMKYEVTIEFHGGEIETMTFKRDSLIEAKKVFNKYLNAWINDKEELNIWSMSIDELS